MKNEDLMQEVSNELNIPFEDVKEMIVLTFKNIKELMEGDIPVEFMFKYLGKLRIFPGRIKALTKGMEAARISGNITEEEYQTHLNFLKQYELATSKGLTKRGSPIK